MENVLTALNWAPPFAIGLVRDLRVRWALGEAGRAHRVELVGADYRKSAEFRSRQPFGQVPTFVADGHEIFESGAIVQLIAEQSDALMPTDPAERAETLAWMYAALNTVKPPVLNLFSIDVVCPGEEWARLRRPAAAAQLADRLDVVAGQLADRDYLLGRFTAADILMATVLRFLGETDALSDQPVLRAYLERCEARPAFRRALAQQLADFETSEPVAA